jgi:choloylglycine hydrolase
MQLKLYPAGEAPIPLTGALLMKCGSVTTKLIAFMLAGAIFGFGVLPAIACTAMVFRAQDGTGIYARTMEWGASDLKSELVLVPRNMTFTSALASGETGMVWNNLYGFVGVNAAGLPYAADGMNEKGLTVGYCSFLVLPNSSSRAQPSSP